MARWRAFCRFCGDLYCDSCCDACLYEGKILDGHFACVIPEEVSPRYIQLRCYRAYTDFIESDCVCPELDLDFDEFADFLRELDKKVPRFQFVVDDLSDHPLIHYLRQLTGSDWSIIDGIKVRELNTFNEYVLTGWAADFAVHWYDNCEENNYTYVWPSLALSILYDCLDHYEAYNVDDASFISKSYYDSRSEPNIK
jgi:hypothetical protein